MPPSWARCPSLASASQCSGWPGLGDVSTPPQRPGEGRDDSLEEIRAPSPEEGQGTRRAGHGGHRGALAGLLVHTGAGPGPGVAR